MLGLILGLWLVARAAVWQSPFPSPTTRTELTNRSGEIQNTWTFNSGSDDRPAGPFRIPRHFGKSFALSALAEPGAPTGRSMPMARHRPVEMLAGQEWKWIGAKPRFPVSRGVANMTRQTGRSPFSKSEFSAFDRSLEPGQNRWSFDGWVLYRPHRGTPVLTGVVPTSYGGSQAGGVLNFSLAPKDPHHPRIYLRGTQAFVGASEAEAAFGMSARPVPGLPVRAMAEMRLQRVSGDIHLRPAVLAVTELPPARLPLGARGEAYLQAGYVGGGSATPFVDGQARITREVASFDLGQVEIGAGLWGGAQEGAARLDAGPTASLHTQVGNAPARLSVDFRERLAGDAAPESGLAITFSVGF